MAQRTRLGAANWGGSVRGRPNLYDEATRERERLPVNEAQPGETHPGW